VPGAEGLTRDHFFTRQYACSIVTQINDDTVSVTFSRYRADDFAKGSPVSVNPTWGGVPASRTFWTITLLGDPAQRSAELDGIDLVFRSGRQSSARK